MKNTNPKIDLPKEVNYIEAFLTYRCNFGCSYCMNGLKPSERKIDEINGDKWIYGLNRLQTKNTPITLGGGEPTMHKDFYKIVNNLDTKIDLLTNLDFDIDEFINNTTPEHFSNVDSPVYKSIRVSFHPHKKDKTLVSRIKKLQDVGFSIGLFGINHPLNKRDNMLMSEEARQNQVYFFVKDFLGIYDDKLFGYYKYPDAINSNNKQDVLCKTKEFFIAPDGKVYKCHRDLYEKENELGNLEDEDLDMKYKFRTCNNYGKCHPCDVKNKTNRFLNIGDCQIEVIKNE